MTRYLHLVCTEDPGYGWTLTSPQVPGLIYGRPTLEAFLAGLDDVLAFAEAPDLPRRMHYQVRRAMPNDVDVMFRLDQLDLDRRADLAARLESMMRADPEVLAANTALRRRSSTGEVIAIMTLATDSIGWLEDQVAAADGDVAFHLDVGGLLIWSSHLSHGPRADGTVTIEDLGLTVDDTVEDLYEVLEHSELTKGALDLVFA